MRVEGYSQIKSALKESESGKLLQKIYRWGQFRTREEDYDWERIIGASSRVSTHMDKFSRLARKFIEYENGSFSLTEKRYFLRGIDLHDIGEAKADSKEDISAQIKTDSDEKEEYKIARRAIKSLNLPDYTKTKLQEAYNIVVKDTGDEKLHFAFKALEKTEYVLTAMQVFLNCRRLRAQGRPAMNEEMEKALVGRVLVIDLPKVLDVYIPKFPNSIGFLFKNAAPLIDEMFDYSLPWLAENKSWKDKDFDHAAKAEEFKVKWKNFKKDLNKDV